MRINIRAAAVAGFLGLTSVIAAPAVAASAAPSGCCIVYGYGPWFSGPTQVADCQAYGATHLGSLWDGYRCAAGTGTHAGQTEVVFYFIKS